STAGSGDYVDGTYTAEGSYQTPETVEQISVTLTLEAGVVSDVEVTGDPQARETEQFQGQFIDGIADEVVGVSIDELNVSRVAGSSLTSGGFNGAVEDIKGQAAG
ncbi:MAG: FMN-binding protein, partial [Microbacteriaceae bacterium]